jgi:hypothetical protein
LGGEAKFRSANPAWADKIDTDQAISVADRDSFWSELDLCPDNDVLSCFQKCCASRQMVGRPVVPLVASEKLGSAQPIESVKNDILTQIPSQHVSPVPVPTRSRVTLIFGRVLDEPDEAKALDDFHREFRLFTIRYVRFPNSRIFAFRSDAPPTCPTYVDTPVRILERLAIPGSAPRDWLLLAFAPEDPALAKRPSCFEAGVFPQNMDAFLPQSGEARTAPASGLPGLREVVIPPPACGRVTRPPRRIV